MTAALEGVRVLDLGIITAGAATSQVFADFGADVIKVESTTYTDPFRNWSQISAAGSQDLNQSPPFWSVNRNKRGVAIDLKTPQGRDLFLALAAEADIVVENFRRGVLERLGIGFDTLKTINPTIILLSLSSQGTSGPDKNYISFGSPLEALGGGMAITGYAAGDPTWTSNNVNFPDQLVSILAPGMALAAIHDRARTREAVHIDLAQREAVTSVVGETLLQASSSGEIAEPKGNRHDWFAPQGVYPAAGEDQWVAISVRSDEQWSSVVEILELAPDLTAIPAASRRERHDDLDLVLAERTASFDKRVLATALQKAGVAAAAVLTSAEVLDHEQLTALGFAQEAPGDPIIQRGFVVRMSETPAAVVRRAPRLGEHTAEVLQQVLHRSDDELAGLETSGVVFTDGPQSVGAKD
ncbi:CaiB/BaiF CoA transferase family protein [Nocardia fluminea]|uniref:CaiB/BaiF CoA transferase family protein n=1 Tax=Nocardia fluminea TaxID=134984 RepID=UPI00341AF0EC